MAENGPREPWEQMPGETPKAFAAFSVYRDAGADRSLSKVAQTFGSSSKIHAWSARYRWVSRSIAWDQEQDRVRRVEQLRAIGEMARRQALAGTLMQSKGLKRIQAINDDEINMLSIWEAIRLVEAGVRLERVARGEPPETVVLQQQNINIMGPRSLSDLPLVSILQHNPERVGPIIAALSQLRQAVPELLADGTIEGQATEVEDESE